MVAYTQECSVENPMGYTEIGNFSVLGSRKLPLPFNTAEATQQFWFHHKYIYEKYL